MCKTGGVAYFLHMSYLGNPSYLSRQKKTYNKFIIQLTKLVRRPLREYFLQFFKDSFFFVSCKNTNQDFLSLLGRLNFSLELPNFTQEN